MSFFQDPSKECEPYRKSGDVSIAPCGAIANSLFNGECVEQLYFPSLSCLA